MTDSPEPTSEQAPEQTDEVARYTNATLGLFDPFVQRAADAVRPIYQLQGRRIPRHVGCGVLVAGLGATFLLTAAHVLEEIGNLDDMVIHGAKHLVRPLDGIAALSETLPGTKREDDDVDAAVIRLSEECAEAVGGRPLLDREIGQPNSIEEARTPILVLGYPFARRANRYDPSERMIQRSHMKLLARRVGADGYASAGLNPHTHVVVSFRREGAATTEGRKTAPSFQGMSGCGMWAIEDVDTPSGLNPEAGRMRLVGIFTDFREPLVIGTRLTQHIGMLLHLLRP